LNKIGPDPDTSVKPEGEGQGWETSPKGKAKVWVWHTNELITLKWLAQPLTAIYRHFAWEGY